jgi:tricorn protease
MRKRFLLLATAALAAGASSSPAQNNNGTRLLRTPSISATHIAFAYAQDIWVVDRKGGEARRITSSLGEESNPQISPDGKWIAFSGQYTGNTDVYIVPIEGGSPKRLTWHNGADNVQGWTPDGKRVLFASSRESNGPNAAPRFFTVGTDGVGTEEALPLNRAFQGKYSPDGTRIAYRMNTSWDDERRNYRGGQNRPIWIADLKTLEVTEARPWTDSKDIDPAWIGDVVYFISDRDGVENVWSYDTKSKRLAQLTRFSDYDVKALDAGGDAVAFEQAGYIHELDPRSGREHIVNIQVNGDFPWMVAQWKDVGSRLTSMAISPSGRRAVVEARGEIFTIPATTGDVRNLTNSSGSAEIEPAWSADGKWISYFSDKSGEYKMVIESADNSSPARELALPNPTHYYTAAWSPDSKKIMYHDTNLHLWVMDVATGTTKIVGEDPWMVPTRTMNPVWSPDSKWISYVKHLNSLYKAIVVYNLETGQTKQISDGLADTSWPAWDASGKYLYFLASTDYGLRSQWLDMSSYDHDETFAMYVAVLSKSDPSPFLPESDEEGGPATVGGGGRGGGGGGGGRAGGGRGGAGGGAADAADPAAPAPPQQRGPVTVNIDFDGLQNRILAVPGVTGRAFSRVKAGAPGQVFYVDPGAGGAAAGGRGGGGGAGSTLQRYDLRARRATAFLTGVTDYEMSTDGRKMLYRAGGGGGGGRGGRGGGAPAAGPQLFIVDSDRNPPAAGSGAINTELRAYIDPKEEYKQIFNEAWRNQRDYLYVPNQHGSDWPRMKIMYGALLAGVNHRADLNYVIDMMGAEIAIGHSYVRGGEMPENPTGSAGAAGGQLGVDFVIDQGRYKITKIYDNESWNPDLRAPLASPGVDVRVGDYILAINGMELKSADNIWQKLEGTSGRQTSLTVNQRPVMDGSRRATVLPIASDQGLRTRAWIEGNRHVVDSISKGQLAYVYLPNTGTGGYDSFNRYYFAQQDRKGAVVDERYNGGGQAADYIIDVLERKMDGYFNNVAGDRVPFTSPAAGIWGPKVMIINEMAGSGGDLMPYMFKLRKIGPLVGKRTWGGLVHTADTPGFVDGGSAIAPRGGFFGLDGKWAVENEGAAPDIDVENWPKDVAAGKDMQLIRSTEEAMRLLALNPPKRLMKEPPPPMWGARIKPIIP